MGIISAKNKNCNILGVGKRKYLEGEKGFGRILEMFLVLGEHNMGIHFDINHSGYFSLGATIFQ